MGGPTSCSPANTGGQNADSGLSVRFCPLPESTRICETHGLAKEGARHPGYTGQRGYHPLLATAADTGDVLMSRLREGRANTARGAADFLRETVGRVRYAGAIKGVDVRRVKPTPGSQLALFATYSYHGFITDREGETPDRGRYELNLGINP